MHVKAKVISYSDGYVPIPGIRIHSKRKRCLKALVIIIPMAIILIYLKLNLNHKTQANDANSNKKVRHSNPCRHVTPEPEIILQEAFDSNDYFFPSSYKERICAATNKTKQERGELSGLQTCFNSEHHCVTRFEKFEVIRVPFPGNLTKEYWKVEHIRIAVACECARTQIVNIYGT